MKKFSFLDSDTTRSQWTSCKPVPEPPEILERAETLAAVFAALERLHPDHRESLLSWCGWPGFPPVAALADSRKRLRQTVYYERDRAIRQLRRDLKRKGFTT